MQKTALKEATAMAKMKDGHFEVVINIERFAPEDVKVFLEDATVYVVGDKKRDGVVCDHFEQKISLPSDVDSNRLTSGISQDGILMIRVPRRKSLDRIIPVMFDAKGETRSTVISRNKILVEGAIIMQFPSNYKRLKNETFIF